jgi:hypothetical protein
VTRDATFEPTVLVGVTPSMRIFREETFRPAAPVIQFRDRSLAACRWMPACRFGRPGLGRQACTQGPCGTSPFEGNRGALRWRDRDALVAVNFLRLTADGAAAHVTASADANGLRIENPYHLMSRFHEECHETGSSDRWISA